MNQQEPPQRSDEQCFYFHFCIWPCCRNQIPEAAQQRSGSHLNRECWSATGMCLPEVNFSSNAVPHFLCTRGVGKYPQKNCVCNQRYLCGALSLLHRKTQTRARKNSLRIAHAAWSNRCLACSVQQTNTSVKYYWGLLEGAPP
ncbi:hypothetical protein M2395_000754 [Pseudomonas sp. BIGb0176]|nr:hypothetical protein [Pseudomonas sp. BIGb0176]